MPARRPQPDVILTHSKAGVIPQYQDVTPAHDQAVTHRYIVHYPDHAPRKGDPHYTDFEAFRRKTHAKAECTVAKAMGDRSECKGLLELHHSHIEFAVANMVDLARLERIYPGVSDADQVGAWIETAANLEWLCTWHHRGHGGIHVAAAADFEAERFVKGLIS